ncbi:CAAX amino terminal protease family protein [Citrus sinensis]|nr:CAAX amino terminal protease family protein [Citrus sinensis]
MVKDDFSVLASDIPWESENVWSTMIFYMFNLHIPLGYGGLSIVAYTLHQPVLDLQTQALSLLLFQVLELSAALFLLSRTIKPEYDLVNFFKTIKSPAERNWLLASALGFAVLTSLVFLASLVADRLFGAKAANNPLVREILLSSDISATAIVLVNCIIAPLLEEAVYRGFLLTSLASTMSWRNAVVISSAIFSVAHFSIDNFLQLFIIGCVIFAQYIRKLIRKEFSSPATIEKCWRRISRLQSGINIHKKLTKLSRLFTFSLFVSHFFRFLLLRKQRALPIPSPVALPFPLHRPLRHLSTHQRSHSVGVAQSLKPLLSRSKH